MTEPVAYLDGDFVPLPEAKVSIFDLGLVQGATVTEMVRTFRHEPFRLDDHLDRLFGSLRSVGFAFSQSPQEVRRIALEVIRRNAQLVPAWQDFGLVLFVTAGQNLTYVGASGAERARTPTFCVHTFPLPYELWASKYDTGQHLVTPTARQIPADSLDPRIKSRSRLHWYLADQEVRRAHPHAAALLLDRNGNVTETSTGNFLVVRGRTICTPRTETTLCGVSQHVVSELAKRLDLEFRETDLSVDDVQNADEAFVSSTPYCLLPVTRLNDSSIGDGVPGAVFRQLMEAWNELAGLDIMSQMSDGAAARTEENPGAT